MEYPCKKKCPVYRFLCLFGCEELSDILSRLERMEFERRAIEREQAHRNLVQRLRDGGAI